MKICRIILKTLLAALLLVAAAVIATGVCPIYRFEDPSPFSGPDIFNPYSECSGGDFEWKRANFHTHTRVSGPFNECDYSPAQADSAYRRLGYDIVTFSNHNTLTRHPFDSTLQVNVYEHGYNLIKYHKLVFGSKAVLRFDNLLPLLVSQKQFQLDLLSKDSDFIQMNHPLRTIGTSRREMESLEGYSIMELDSGKSTENEYWDWALSAGHYSFCLANDDLHRIDRTTRIAVRSNFLRCESGRYEDIRECLLSGGSYAMRVPNYGSGNWETKIAKNQELPKIDCIGVKADSIFISLSCMADSIKFTGQDHRTIFLGRDTANADLKLESDEPYARITAYFSDGAVIYTNPFARYDAAEADSPFRPAISHSVNIPLTVLYNLLLLVLLAAVVLLEYRVIKR